MEKISYLLTHFFTHKAYLLPPDQLPGTLFTPMAFGFYAFWLFAVIAIAYGVARHPRRMKAVLAANWAVMVVWEVVIVTWESLSGPVKGLDLTTNLSLYPCSLYLYTTPFLLWGRGIWKKMASGYLLTLGLLGAAVNFIYPVTRLTDYSCLSFAGFHTALFHGSILLAWLTVLLTGYCSYEARSLRELFLPCIPSLLLSIPANLVNYSGIDSDYMFFRGKMGVVAYALPGFSEVQTTLTLYALYILIPALFFLPSYLHYRRQLATQEQERLVWGWSFRP